MVERKRPGVVLGHIIAELRGGGPDAEVNGADFVDFVNWLLDVSGYEARITEATRKRLEERE